MDMIAVLSILGLVRFLNAVRCDKELNYYDNYGYGFDVICEGITDEHQKLLRTLSVYNELRLEIRNSSLSNVSGDLFARVKKIRYLVFNNSLIRFNEDQEVFKNLSSLEHFTVANSGIESLSNNTFQALAGLKELKLTNDSLSRIDATYLGNLSSLENLDLSFNKIDAIDSLQLCKLHKLRSLYMQHNFVKTLRRKNFGCQKNRSLNLIEINLGFNRIEEIENLNILTKLKHLNLENNRLKSIKNDMFMGMSKLEKIWLRNNDLSTIEDGALKNLNALKVLDAQGNKLTSLHLDNLPQLTYLNLARNQLITSSLSQLNNLPKLKTLLLSSNHLRGVFIPLHNCSSIETLYLSDNSLIFDDSSFKLLANVQELSLKNNSVEEVTAQMFENLTNLQLLDLSNNKIETFPNNGVFKDLVSLKVLNMSHNLLTYLGYDILQPLVGLQVLDIAGNRLINIEYDLISLLPSLRTINVRSNRLSCSFLSKIIRFFKSKYISYTINEKFEFERENVAGIYCQEMSEVGFSNVKLAVTIASVVFVVIVAAFVSFKFAWSWRRRAYIMDEMELIED